MMPLHSGQVLQDRYRIDVLLGQGGMGAVYRATDLRFHAAVAIKENLEVSPEAQKQFAREAGLLHQLRHPNLPHVTDYFFLAGQGQYLVMDFIEGQDLGQVLAHQGAIPEAQALAWMRQVLEALDYLHSRNVIHRDVKPANVKITPQGQVFLVDFGLAKVYDPVQKTTMGARAVTPGYAPPEQYGMGRTDARSDLYSVGATLYALLTGQTPPDALEYVTGQAHLVPPRQLNSRISSSVETTVLRAMQTRPADRFQTVAEFRAALLEPPTRLLPDRELGLAPVTPSPARWGPARVAQPAPAAPGWRTRPAWQWGVGALALLLVIVGLWRLFRVADGGEPTPTAIAEVSPVATTTAPVDPPPAATDTPSTRTLTPTPTASAVPPLTPPTDTPTPTPTGTPTLTPTPTDTRTPTPTSTRTITPSPTPSPTVTRTPTPTATPKPKSAGRMAFVSERDGNREIYVMNADGSNVRRLTDNPADDRFLAWSPDGTRAAFTTKRDGNWEIYLMNADGSGLRNLTNHPDADRNPSWSPDGQQIAFMSDRNGNPEIYVMNLDGSGLRNLTNQPSQDRAPSWSKGGRIAFNSDRSGNLDIYVMNTDGSRLTQLTTHPASDSFPVWSPNGQRIVFISERDGNAEIYVMNADGSGQTNLTNHPANDMDPCWSPDGQRIAFMSERDGNWEVYVMDADGGHLANLTNHPAYDGQPSWAPK
jgi:serine/threonine protein kinase